MAWIFSLSAECGTEKSVAERLVQHFQNYDPEFEDGSRHPVTAYLEEIDGACWVICVPAGITRTGMGSANDERVATQVAIKLYERLRTATGFRFAIVGVEVAGLLAYQEIDCDDFRLDLSGLVVSESLWIRLHKPGLFDVFSPGYYWWPFQRVR